MFLSDEFKDILLRIQNQNLSPAEAHQQISREMASSLKRKGPDNRKKVRVAWMVAFKEFSSKGRYIVGLNQDSIDELLEFTTNKRYYEIQNLF